MPLCKENLAREDKSSQGVPRGTLEPSPPPLHTLVPPGPLEAVSKRSWGVRRRVRSCSVWAPRSCVQTPGGTSPVCSVLETHRGRGLLFPVFRPSRDLSQCLSAPAQTVKLLPNLDKPRATLGGSQAGRFVGGAAEN